VPEREPELPPEQELLPEPVLPPVRELLPVLLRELRQLLQRILHKSCR
jgi:hypothetical protein